MKNKTSLLLIVAIGVLITFIGLSSFKSSEGKKEIVYVRVIEAGGVVPCRILIQKGENQKVVDLQSGLIYRSEMQESNLKKIANVLQELYNEGYSISSSASSGDGVVRTDYVLVK